MGNELGEGKYLAEEVLSDKAFGEGFAGLPPNSTTKERIEGTNGTASV